LPVASNDPDAKTLAANLINPLGFDTVDAGTLDQTWRFEPETSAYTRIYLANPNVPLEQITQVPATALPARKLGALLKTAERVQVAQRSL